MVSVHVFDEYNYTSITNNMRDPKVFKIFQWLQVHYLLNDIINFEILSYLLCSFILIKVKIYWKIFLYTSFNFSLKAFYIYKLGFER